MKTYTSFKEGVAAMIKDKTRLMEMCAMAEKGMSYQEIGEHYGLTRERVR